MSDKTTYIAWILLAAALIAENGKGDDEVAREVKALIAKFVEPPKKSHDIPQNLRHDFLKKLEELK